MHIHLDMNLTRKMLPNLLIWTVWIAIMITNITLVVGSYQESEPRAGLMFGYITMGCALLGPCLWYWLHVKQNKKA